MKEKRQTILIVDDVEMNRYILAQQFCVDFDVLEAGNGVEAVDCIEKNYQDIAVIILDLQMPIADGYYVLRKMKENGWQTPVIVSTALDSIDSEVKAIEMGALDYVTKPIKPRVLAIRVSSALAKKQSMQLQIENQRLLTQKEEEARYQKELQYTLMHDDLTGLYSKRGFIDEAAKLIAQNPDINFAIVRLGIRQFKIINELFGYAKGDIILKAIAKTLTGMEKGVYSRWEADNFCMCIPTERLKADYLTKLSKSLSGMISDYLIELTCGIYKITDRKMPISSMCDRALLAEKDAKRNPGEDYCIYTEELNQKLLLSSAILSEFDTAIKNKEFVIYLQPIVSLSHRGIVSAEALVRWKHPQKGMIPPGVFIDVLERNGKIAELDYAVWELACEHLKYRQDNNLPDIPVSVNLSRIHLANPNLVNIINGLITKYSISPKLLRLEITETAYVSNKNMLLLTLTQLQENGFTIMMDDFGSGYSSVNMLKDLPVDILKIDMRLIEDVTTSTKAGSIMFSIVNMARMLGIDVIAEGVETSAQVEFLRSVGCDKIQGFYFSPPLPVKEFELAAASKKFAGRKEESTSVAVKDITELFSAGSLVNKMLNSVYGAIGFYLYKNHQLSAIRVNDKYYEIMDYDVNSFKNDAGNVLARVHPDDVGSLIQAFEQVAITEKPERRVFRRYAADGTVLCLDTIINFVGRTPDIVISIAFSDITAYISSNVDIKFEKKDVSSDKKD